MLLLAVPLPSISLVWLLYSHGPSTNCSIASSDWSVSIPSGVASVLGLSQGSGLVVDANQVCHWAMAHPLALLNVLFFLNVDVLFWIISLFQGSTWLIDPYWTIVPVLIAHFFAAHPAANPGLRSVLSLALVWAWSIRLTHSYLRREQWQLGAREDWRFADMRKQFGWFLWSFLSFPIVYLPQHVMLVGISLPFYSTHFPSLSALPASCSPTDVLGLSTLLLPHTNNGTAALLRDMSSSQSIPSFDVWDAMIVALCLAGILIAYFADTQLHAFMAANEKLEKQGKPKVLILNTGLWYYSRHPNYFGEQLWWWGLSLFSIRMGQWYMAAGTLINSLVLATVTVMVEQRMLDKPARKQAFLNYKRTTSVLIPWFKGSLPASAPRGKKKEN